MGRSLQTEGALRGGSERGFCLPSCKGEARDAREREDESGAGATTEEIVLTGLVCEEGYAGGFNAARAMTGAETRRDERAALRLESTGAGAIFDVIAFGFAAAGMRTGVGASRTTAAVRDGFASCFTSLEGSVLGVRSGFASTFPETLRPA